MSQSPDNPPPFQPPKLSGMKWKCLVNGRKAANGARYGVTFNGEIESAPEGLKVYDVVKELLEHVEMNNTEMEFPDSIQILLQ